MIDDINPAKPNTREATKLSNGDGKLVNKAQTIGSRCGRLVNRFQVSGSDEGSPGYF